MPMTASPPLRVVVAPSRRGTAPPASTQVFQNPYAKWGQYYRKLTYAEKPYERQTVAARMATTFSPGPIALVKGLVKAPIQVATRQGREVPRSATAARVAAMAKKIIAPFQ